MRDDRERLLDILDAIIRIEKYAPRGEQAFRNDELLQTWMTANIQVIGEAARNLSSELRDRYPGVPWSEMAGMRHILVHEYFEVDLDVVWTVVSKDVPKLKRDIQAVLEALGPETEDTGSRA